MDEEPRSLVIQIINRYSLDVINDKDRFGNLLNDYFQGKYRKERNTLVASLEEGIPGDLIKSHTSVPVSMLAGQLARRLTENRGISEDLALWTVTTWAVAFQIPVEAAGAAPQPGQVRTVSLTVNSTPPGAKVFINSQYVGDSPITVTSVPAGSNHVQCVLDGYEEWKKNFDFDPSTHTYSVDAALVKLASKKAWIFTASNPPGALIYLNGVFKGNTPLSIPDLQPGNHSIKFTLRDYKIWEETVVLRPGQLLNVHANLDRESNAGALRVLSDPPGAACYIDGQYQGIVPSTYSGLPAGNHHVRCTFKGRSDIARTVEVITGKTVEITFTFAPAIPQGSCDFCHRVQPLPFTCTRCGGQFCTEHRLPENHQCSARRKKAASATQQSSTRPSPRVAHPPPSAASVSQRPVRRPPSPKSSFGPYAYTATVSGFLAFIFLIAGGVDLMFLGLMLVCMYTAYAAWQEREK